MDGKSFATHSKLDFPRSWHGQDYLNFLDRLFSDFKGLIDSVDGEDRLSKRIAGKREDAKDLCDGILKTVKRYLEGHPSEAYSLIVGKLDKFKEQDQLGSIFKIWEPTPENSIGIQQLYRIRTTDIENPAFKRRDLFHIPFDLRHRVKPQRFSIEGLPSLYLGGSIYVCWEELGRPDLNRVCMSKFEAVDGENLRVVNMVHNPASWRLIEEEQPGYLLSNEAFEFVGERAILWPLLVSCHIRVRHRESPFKPEYIIPQMLMQWVRSNPGMDGIAYRSTHIKRANLHTYGQINFVFPSKEIRPEGHCPRLVSQFELTEPLSWQIADTISDDKVADIVKRFPGIIVDMGEGLSYSIYKTKFFEMQAILEKMGTRRLEQVTDALTFIERAANTDGKSLSDFVASAAISAAQKTIGDSEIIQLSVEDQRRFAELLINPPVAAEALARAKENHSSLIQESI